MLYPALSRTQLDHDQVNRLLVRAVGVVALLLFPAVIGLAVVAEVLMPMLVGEQWHGVALLISILAPAGAYQAVHGQAKYVLTALGRPELTFRWDLFEATVYVTAFLIGLRWGVVGVTVAYATAMYLTAPGCLVIVRHLTGLSLRQFYRSLAPVAVASALVGFSAFGVLRLTNGNLEGLVAAIATGVVVYVATVVIWRPLAVNDLLAAIRRRSAS